MCRTTSAASTSSALYIGYTDDKFKEKIEQDAYLGFLGPILHGEVGDKISVTFSNKCAPSIAYNTSDTVHICHHAALQLCKPTHCDHCACRCMRFAEIAHIDVISQFMPLTNTLQCVSDLDV